MVETLYMGQQIHIRALSPDYNIEIPVVKIIDLNLTTFFFIPKIEGGPSTILVHDSKGCHIVIRGRMATNTKNESYISLTRHK